MCSKWPNVAGRELLRFSSQWYVFGGKPNCLTWFILWSWNHVAVNNVLTVVRGVKQGNMGVPPHFMKCAFEPRVLHCHSPGKEKRVVDKDASDGDKSVAVLVRGSWAYSIQVRWELQDEGFVAVTQYRAASRFWLPFLSGCWSAGEKPQRDLQRHLKIDRMLSKPGV